MSESAVLIKSVFRAGHSMGLSDAVIGDIIGLNQSKPNPETPPRTETEQRAVSFLECYQALYNLTGGAEDEMAHWLRTENRHTGGIPVRQMVDFDELAKISDYLTALCQR